MDSQAHLVGTAKSLIKSIKAIKNQKQGRSQNKKFEDTVPEQFSEQNSSSRNDLEPNVVEDDGVKVGVDPAEEEEYEEDMDDDRTNVGSDPEEDDDSSASSSEEERDPEVSFRDQTDAESDDLSDEASMEEDEKEDDSDELDPEDPRVKKLLEKLLKEDEEARKEKKRKTKENKATPKRDKGTVATFKSPSDFYHLYTCFAKRVNKSNKCSSKAYW